MAPRPVYALAKSQPSTDMLATSDEVGNASGRVTKVPNCALRQLVKGGRARSLNRRLAAQLGQRVVGHAVDEKDHVFHRIRLAFPAWHSTAQALARR